MGTKQSHGQTARDEAQARGEATTTSEHGATQTSAPEPTKAEAEAAVWASVVASAPKPKARKARKSKGGETPDPRGFLRDTGTANAKGEHKPRIRFVPGRDATLASVCRRVLAGTPQEGDLAVLAHTELTEHPKVVGSAYLAPLVAAAVAHVG